MNLVIRLLFGVFIGLLYLGSLVHASIRGTPGVDYPNYLVVPRTSFNCLEQEYLPGIYADIETGCQVFHYCYEHRKESFLCPPGTIFNQPLLACDYWYSVNCSLATAFFSLNSRNNAKLHSNIPIVVKLQPDSSDEDPGSTESLFEKFTSRYDTNPRNTVSPEESPSNLREYESIEQSFKNQFGEAEFEGEDQSSPQDNFEQSKWAVDDSGLFKFDRRDLYFPDQDSESQIKHQEDTTASIHELNDDYLFSSLSSDEFHPEVPENFQPEMSRYNDYRGSETEEFAVNGNIEDEIINSNSGGEKALNFEYSGSEGHAEQTSPFNDFSKRTRAIESLSKRPKRKPLYFVSENEIEFQPKIIFPKEENKLPPRKRTTRYPYIEGTDSRNTVVTTELYSEPLTTVGDILNNPTEFTVKESDSSYKSRDSFPGELNFHPESVGNPLEITSSSEADNVPELTTENLEQLEVFSSRDGIVSEENSKEEHYSYNTNEGQEDTLAGKEDNSSVWIQNEDSDMQDTTEAETSELDDQKSKDLDFSYTSEPHFLETSEQHDEASDLQYTYETEFPQADEGEQQEEQQDESSDLQYTYEAEFPQAGELQDEGSDLQYTYETEFPQAGEQQDEGSYLQHAYETQFPQAGEQQDESSDLQYTYESDFPQAGEQQDEGSDLQYTYETEFPQAGEQQDECSDLQYTYETHFPQPGEQQDEGSDFQYSHKTEADELGSEYLPDYGMNYPSYMHEDYSYQSGYRVYDDLVDATDYVLNSNSEFRPNLGEQRNLYETQNGDYRMHAPLHPISDKSQRSWTHPVYGELQSLGVVQDQSFEQTRWPESINNRYNSGDSVNGSMDESNFISPEFMSKSVFHSRPDGKIKELGVSSEDKFQSPSLSIRENFPYVYNLPEDNHYSYDHSQFGVDILEISNEQFGANIHSPIGMEEAVRFEGEETHSGNSNSYILPGVDYVSTKGESGEDHQFSDNFDGQHTENRDFMVGVHDIKEVQTEFNYSKHLDAKGDYPNLSPNFEELLEKWKKIYFKSLADYRPKQTSDYSSHSKSEGTEREYFKEFEELPENVRKTLARDAWEKIETSGTLICQISNDDLAFSPLFTEEMSSNVRQQIKREALMAVYSTCLSKAEREGDSEDFKDLTEDYLDFADPQPNLELDEDIDYTEPKIPAKTKQEISRDAWDSLFGKSSFIQDDHANPINGAEAPSTQSEYIEPKFIQSGVEPPKDGVLLDDSKMPSRLNEQQTTEETSEGSQVGTPSQHNFDLPGLLKVDQDVINDPTSTSEILGEEVLKKPLASSGPKLSEKDLPTDLHGEVKTLSSLGSKEEPNVPESSPPLETFKSYEKSTHSQTSEQNQKLTGALKTGKSVQTKENKPVGGSPVQISNEAELLNRLVFGNSKDFAGQTFGNFPLELQQQHYKAFPNSMQSLQTGQPNSGRPVSKTRSSSLPRHILSMKSNKLKLLTKYIEALKKQR